MEQKLKQLFDYQRFDENPRLASLIEETESRYRGRELSDNDLELVSAAGDIFAKSDDALRHEQDGK